MEIVANSEMNLMLGFHRYRGSYCSQDVAIKVVMPERITADMYRDFAQEVYIMRLAWSYLLTLALPGPSRSPFVTSFSRYFTNCTYLPINFDNNNVIVSWFIHTCRKVRHRNVVQFIGACTRQPNLYIVTGIQLFCSKHANKFLIWPPYTFFPRILVLDFMSGGSVYDYLHKKNSSFKLPEILRVATDISKGMNYLHQNNIIHRDLKTANLLMDENKVSLIFFTKS